MLVQVGLRIEESNLLNKICFGLLWLKIKTLSSVTKFLRAKGKISFFGRQPDKSLWRHPMQGPQRAVYQSNTYNSKRSVVVCMDAVRGVM